MGDGGQIWLADHATRQLIRGDLARRTGGEVTFVVSAAFGDVQVDLGGGETAGMRARAAVERRTRAIVHVTALGTH